MRFALNADKALDAGTQAVYVSTWADGFADVDPDRLKAAFITCLRSHTFKTMPTIGDVRKHLSEAEAKAGTFEAEQKWTQVLGYIREHYHPDLSNYRAPRLSAHTDHAVRAAGGLAFINECSKESLQWAKKRFIEDYVAWTELDRGQFLLPDGSIRAMFKQVAEAKQLPATNRAMLLGDKAAVE